MTLNIGQRIDGRYGELSPQEQRAADFILDHMSDLAVYNASELARLSGVSKATVSRLFRRLGFQDSAEVREHARSLRNLGSPLGGPGASAGTPSRLAAHAEAEQDNLRRLLVTLEDGRLDAAARLVRSAQNVVIVGLRNSYPLALHLRQQLVQARDHVRLAPLPGQSLGEELAGLGPRDVVVLMGFRRRVSGFGDIVAAIRSREVPLVLIADSSARKYSDQATHWLECPVDSVSAFDSYATAMSLMNLLATGAMGAQVRESRTRIAAITSVYEDLDELEAPW
ncbi:MULTISPECIES: MurR/RpiR family transcriptional regulator [Cryobacterium]|uniref:MurR/RpiR family transcriptional regulator n=1 Tax=Cryobacterium zongtaii TaxID=1259217 RepID=A0A2S3Z797_9MICO|nr:MULTISPECIES: MurR/RpiR family transcriptional regulator [Cryobacterium]POH61414.1 MurR/RpiR family transcriptional regulator [Cryobacterium zongtaii]POH62170.1 MurR/RpiR family transcriptional regulator [Cryobacterium zongtaii]POH67972.1 MurR/RpiR family transcriptional regulator [Cryobacterium zongtaii]TFC47976.1 MurR/RpiR family transcriptional regulator [Cryobacterium sp. TMN-39-2]TFC53544.1 MurR/RpiR family transcriptional regulator [Cryobacterium sp. TMB3-1-2]